MSNTPQTFETIKIGVCDCFWRPRATQSNPTPDEIYLGLAKGGCELTYTPNWHEIQVDQFGKTATESVLIGEDIKVKVPLAETDLSKLELFAHTSTKIIDGITSGVTQIETATVVGTIGASGAGNATVVVTAFGMPNSPKTLSVAVSNDDTASLVAGKIRDACITDSDIAGFFTVSGSTNQIILTCRVASANDPTLNISIDNGTCTGLTAANTSEDTRAGVAPVTKSKLTFGRKPGFRLEGVAGQIRVHPIAMGSSNEEDVIIYRAANRAPLQLNYKLDEERIFSTEFQGIVARQSLEEELAGTDGAFLWQIGNPTI
jgi:hypothetical protein